MSYYLGVRLSGRLRYSRVIFLAGLLVSWHPPFALADDGPRLERPIEQWLAFDGVRRTVQLSEEAGRSRTYSGTPALDGRKASLESGSPDRKFQIAQSNIDPILTLRGELRRVLDKHPRIKSDLQRVAAAKQGERAAFSGFLPRVSVSGDAGPEHVDSPQTRARAGGGDNDSFRQQSTLTLTQNIFDGFQTPANYSGARIESDIATMGLEATRQSLLLEGVTAYYTVLRQHQLLGIARQNEITTKEQLQLEDERVRRGSGISVDVLLAKTRLQLAKERRVQLKGTLDEAVARYVQVFDRLPSPDRMADPKVPVDLLPISVSEALKSAIDKNPALQASDQRVELANQNRRSAAGDFYPRVDLVGEANWEQDVDGIDGIRRDWSVVVRLTWEFFSGFSTSARVSGAAFERSAAVDTHNFNRRRVSEELRIAWDQLSTARQRVELLDNAVNIAEQVFRARQELRDKGRETSLNVLDAQNEVFAARINLVAAQFDSQLAVFRVLFSMGLLTAENLGI